ncbi:MAG: hypothetical protein KF816_17125 [Melioribacteraceae bacterium]|nr:hypothetical protein [Melioribacteraceae bacterium]
MSILPNEELIKLTSGELKQQLFSVPIHRVKLLYFTKNNPPTHISRASKSIEIKISASIGGLPLNDENVELLFKENPYLQGLSEEQFMEYIKNNVEVKVNDYTLEEDEPSMIFLSLPIEKPKSVVENKFNLNNTPNYLEFSPVQRWEYFKMLEDLSKPYSRDIVLVYLYCLERRLLEKEAYTIATNEIISLVNYNKFLQDQDYLIKILIFVTIKWNDSYFIKLLLKELNKYPINRYSLMIKYHLKISLKAEDLFVLVQQTPNINKRYLKENSDLYFNVLENTFEEFFGSKEYHFYNEFDKEEIPLSYFNPFQNYSKSLSEEIATFKIYDFVYFNTFQQIIISFHTTVHARIKEYKRKNRAKSK